MNRDRTATELLEDLADGFCEFLASYGADLATVEPTADDERRHVALFGEVADIIRTLQPKLRALSAMRLRIESLFIEQMIEVVEERFLDNSPIPVDSFAALVGIPVARLSEAIKNGKLNATERDGEHWIRPSYFLKFLREKHA